MQVSPNARTNEIVGVRDEVLKVRLQAQPVDGKANDALVRYIAKMLNVPQRTVMIIRGHTSKRKVLQVSVPQIVIEEAKEKLCRQSSQQVGARLE